MDIDNRRRIDITETKNGRSKRHFIGFNVSIDDYQEHYEQMRNVAGTVNGLVIRHSLLAREAMWQLGKVFELWEIATLLASMGAHRGGLTLYTGHLPNGAAECVTGLADRVGNDKLILLSRVREWSSAVHSGSRMTQDLEQAYEQKWGVVLRWDMGSRG